MSEKIICLEMRKGTDKMKGLKLVAPLFKKDIDLGMDVPSVILLLGMQLMERAREAPSPLCRKELSAQFALIMKHENVCPVLR